MPEECKHKNLRLSHLEDRAQDYETGHQQEEGWEGGSDPVGTYYIISGSCVDCGKELTTGEIKKLTGLPVYKAEFTEV